jgi:Outer membrane receptor proteins, mostly Fe transport
MLAQLSLEELLQTPVTTASLVEERYGNAPAVMLIVTEATIRERGYRNLLDLLEDLPGFDVQRNAGENIYARVAQWGAEGINRFLILLNGHRIGAPAGEYVAIGDNFPLLQARRVEILYGPAAAVFGADAFVGVINIITDDERLAQGFNLGVLAGEEKHYNFHLRYHRHLSEQIQFTYLMQYDVDHFPKLDEAYPEAFQPVAAITEAGDTVVPADARETFHAQEEAFSVWIHLQLTPRTNLYFIEHRFRIPTSLGERPAYAIYSPDAHYTTLIQKYLLEHKQALTASAELRSTLDFHLLRVDPSSNFQNIYSNFKPGYKYAYSQLFTLKEEFHRSVKNRILAIGLESNHYSVLPKTMDLDHPFDTRLSPEEQKYYYPGTDSTLRVKFFPVTYRNFGVYFHWAWSGKHWNLTLGTRGDWNSRYGASVNPRLGIIFTPHTRTSFKLLYGEAFLAPSPQFVYGQWGSFNDSINAQGECVSNFFHLPNPDLKSEKIRTLSLAILSDLPWGGNLSFDAYYSRMKNLRTTIRADSLSRYIEGGFIEYPQIYGNTGKGEFAGIDLSYSINLIFNYWRLAPWISYSYVTGHRRNPGEPWKETGFFSPHKIKGGLTIGYRSHYFTTLRFRYVSSTLSGIFDGSNPTRRKRIPGYLVWDLHLGKQKITPSLTIELDVRNLFDLRYYQPGMGTKTAFLENPQDPRTWYVRVEKSFQPLF